jgi:hypothetical protein
VVGDGDHSNGAGRGRKNSALRRGPPGALGLPRFLAARQDLHGAVEPRITPCGETGVEPGLDGRGDADAFKALAIHAHVFDRGRQQAAVADQEGGRREQGAFPPTSSPSRGAPSPPGRRLKDGSDQGVLQSPDSPSGRDAAFGAARTRPLTSRWWARRRVRRVSAALRPSTAVRSIRHRAQCFQCYRDCIRDLHK